MVNLIKFLPSLLATASFTALYTIRESLELIGWLFINAFNAAATTAKFLAKIFKTATDFTPSWQMKALYPFYLLGLIIATTIAALGSLLITALTSIARILIAPFKGIVTAWNKGPLATFIYLGTDTLTGFNRNINIHLRIMNHRNREPHYNERDTRTNHVNLRNERTPDILLRTPDLAQNILNMLIQSTNEADLLEAIQRSLADQPRPNANRLSPAEFENLALSVVDLQQYQSIVSNQLQTTALSEDERKTLATLSNNHNDTKKLYDRYTELMDNLKEPKDIIDTISPADILLFKQYKETDGNNVRWLPVTGYCHAYKKENLKAWHTDRGPNHTQNRDNILNPAPHQEKPTRYVYHELFNNSGQFISQEYQMVVQQLREILRNNLVSSSEVKEGHNPAAPKFK